MKIGDIQLTRTEKDVLLSTRKWLSDDIINAAQNLLKQQFSVRGLQHTFSGQGHHFSVMRGEFVQILHTTSHWTTISTMGLGDKGAESVLVYDSLYTTMSREDNNQICSLMLSPHECSAASKWLRLWLICCCKCNSNLQWHGSCICNV